MRYTISYVKSFSASFIFKVWPDIAYFVICNLTVESGMCKTDTRGIGNRQNIFGRLPTKLLFSVNWYVFCFFFERGLLVKEPVGCFTRVTKPTYFCYLRFPPDSQFPGVQTERRVVHPLWLILYPWSFWHLACFRPLCFCFRHFLLLTTVQPFRWNNGVENMVRHEGFRCRNIHIHLRSCNPVK